MWAHESHVGQSVPWWKEKMRVVPVSQDHGRKRAHSCLLPVFIRKEVYPNWLCKWGGVSACETDAYWEGGGIKSTVNETAVIMSSRSSYLVSFLPHITAVSLMVVLDWSMTDRKESCFERRWGMKVFTVLTSFVPRVSVEGTWQWWEEVVGVCSSVTLGLRKGEGLQYRTSDGI